MALDTRVLDGVKYQCDRLGNMKSDYKCDDTVDKESIIGTSGVFYIKKVYAVKLSGKMKDGSSEPWVSVHSRMKGVNGKAIEHTIKKLYHKKNNDTTIELYRHLCKPKIDPENDTGEHIPLSASVRRPVLFDMLAGGENVSFKFTNSGSSYRSEFPRVL
jgi:hypothetical protein